MNKLFFKLTFLGLFAFILASCGGSDDPMPAPQASITVEDDASYTTNDFEVGETVSLNVDLTAPEGVTIFQVLKTVGSGTPVPVFIDLNSLPATGQTSFTGSFDIPVQETVGDEVTVTVQFTQGQGTTFISSTYVYDVVAQGQGGGGGAFPLLRAEVTVSLGGIGSPTGSYLSTVTGTVFTNAEAASANAAIQQAIDITYGAVDSNNDPWNGMGTLFDALVSPHVRTGNPGEFENPMGANATETTFKAEAGVSSIDNVTSSSVENDIDHSSGTNSIQRITANNVYSFVNDAGAKGYVEVKSFSGSGNNRVVTLDVIVQMVQ